MQKIIFATGNAHKMIEIRQILDDPDWEILSMKEAGIDIDINETGTTFEENATIKAEAVAAYIKAHLADAGKKGWSDAIVLADDSGLEIDYLNKEPGIYSSRYGGEDTSYDIKNQMLLDRLDGVPKEQRTARFVCAIAAAFSDREPIVVRGTIEGYIGDKPAGENGFGYDPIFYVEDKNCSTAELSPEEKNARSHRGNALRLIKEKLTSLAL
ncbi:MAG: RdgB/HAM1 family non-canonical purine NTP pyrophosphatase [Eubacterium sp.]|nr:RdgB/HAM1 family non-canonical purine NTP pyrophosphatase [Eubacterium sp.]MBQ9023003.1 RdgB/HAM1 family non-canonical purine NTP pyrophosphatase [Eubacterium sp.]